MANNSSSSPAPRGRRPQPAQSRTVAIVVAAIVGIVAVAGVVVALVVGWGDDDDAATASTAANGDTASISTTANRVAICAPSTGSTSASASSPLESDVELAAFSDDDIFKPVAVDGAALPAFTQEIQQGAPDIALCEPAPVVSGYNYAGEEVSIDATVDGPTMVVLLAHWCPHCNREIPVLNAWRDSGEFPDNLNIVGVSTGVSSQRDNFPPDEWLTAVDWQWPILADSDAGADDPDDDVVASAFRAYGGTTFPTMLFIGSDGRLLARASGELPVDVIAALADDALAQDADT